MLFIGNISIIVGLSLSCIQCSSVETPSCLVSPPNPSACNAEANYCLTLKEYVPSTQGKGTEKYTQTFKSVLTRRC